MTDDVTVSVIIPTYRREKELVEAMESVLAQQGVAFEVIVVDDSAEGSARAAVESCGEPKIRYVRREAPSNARPALVRNTGAALARGRYLHFLDDDDRLAAGALARMAKALDARPEAGMVFGAVAPFGSDAALLRHHEEYFQHARSVARTLRSSWQLGAWLTFRPPVLVCSACMGRRAAFEAAGGFDADIPVCEDAELWARIAQSSEHVFIDDVVVHYRTGAPSLMHDLAPDDEKLHVSYRRIQTKYRRANGWVRFLAMKGWARLPRP